MMNRFFTLAIIATTPLPVLASEKPEEEIEEVVVTASRVSTPISRVLAPVTVINKADINRTQPPSLGALLDGSTGVNTQASGSLGSQTELMIRGSSSAQAIVLLDGMRISSATNGGAPIQYIEPESIERIEVVRGSRSSLYGADAVGGVVQIFTHEGLRAEDFHSAYIKQGLGSHDSWRTSARIKSQHGNSYYQFSASHFQSHGFDSTTVLENGNNDRDGFDNTTFNASFGHQFNQDLQVRLTAFHSAGQADYDQSPFDYDQAVDPYHDYAIQALSARIDYQLTDSWRTELMLADSRNDDTSYDRLSDTNGDILGLPAEFNTQRHFYNWLNTFEIDGHHRLMAGIDFQQDQLFSSNVYDEDQRDNLAAYGQYEFNGEVVQLSVSARSDDNSAYGDNNTGQIEAGFHITDQLLIGSSYGTAFRAPTFNDLYFPSSGNPDVKAETSANSELFVRGRHELLNWQLNVFHNDVDDMIAWAPIDPSDPGGFWQPFNIAQATLKGTEFTIDADIGEYALSANYSYLMTEDGKTGKELTYRPQHTINVDISRQWGELNITWIQQFRSQSYIDIDNTATLDGYGLSHLRFGYELPHDVQLSLALNNLFDKQYQIKDGYNTDGFNVMFSVSYTPSW